MEDFTESATECLKGYVFTLADVSAAAKAGNPSVIDSCYWGFYFKKIGYINDKGEYDPTIYLEKVKEFFQYDKKRESYENIIHQCDSVKGVTISNDEAGCEMGSLLATCTFEHELEKEKVIRKSVDTAASAAT